MQQQAVGRQPFFIATQRGARFAIATEPAGTPVGGLLYVHPFAEEMNKSRRAVALASQAFAERGWLVLQIDLSGCGDSEGDFGDADWQGWLDDISCGWDWLSARCSMRCLWTLRAGSLVAADWLKQRSERPPLLLWQPVTSGAQHLNQFLRLKSANEMLAGGSSKDADTRLRSELKANRPVEIAGYRLSPAIAAGLGGASMQLPAGYPAPIAVFETVSSPPAELSPAVAAMTTRWRDAGATATDHAVQGPSFWRTQEIETAPELIAASIRALELFVA